MRSNGNGQLTMRADGGVEAAVRQRYARASHETEPCLCAPSTGLFYADWCASCKVLEPKLNEVKKQVMDQPMTRVDLTDECTKKQSGMFAEWVGLSEIYRKHAPKTGFMLLIDAKKVLDELTKTQSEAELKVAMERALAKAK